MYTEKDFNNLQFNPLCKEGILEAYPKLKEIIDQEYLSEPNIDGILRFIILTYDSKSKLALTEKDMNYRKGVAADLAKLPQDESYRETVYSLGFPIVLELTVRYLIRFVRSREWAAIVALEYKFWESLKKMITPINETTANAELQAVQKKAVISEEIDKDIERLEKYYKAFFGDDTLLNVVKEKRWTPESIGKLKT